MRIKFDGLRKGIIRLLRGQEQANTYLSELVNGTNDGSYKFEDTSGDGNHLDYSPPTSQPSDAPIVEPSNNVPAFGNGFRLRTLNGEGARTFSNVFSLRSGAKTLEGRVHFVPGTSGTLFMQFQNDPALSSFQQYEVHYTYNLDNTLSIAWVAYGTAPSNDNPDTIPIIVNDTAIITAIFDTVTGNIGLYVDGHIVAGKINQAIHSVTFTENGFYVGGTPSGTSGGVLGANGGARFEYLWIRNIAVANPGTDATVPISTSAPVADSHTIGLFQFDYFGVVSSSNSLLRQILAKDTEIDEDLTDGSQKTQIVGSDGVNLGTNSNPLIVNPGTVAVTGPITQSQFETEIDEKLGDLGQKASAGSAPVVLSTEQEALIVLIKAAVQEIALDTDNLDINLTALANLLKGSGSKDFTTLQTAIDTLVTQGQNNKVFEETVWKDTNGTFYIHREFYKEGDASITNSNVLVDGSAYTVVGAANAQIPVGNNKDYEFEHYHYKANTSGTGFSNNDFILRSNLYDVSSGTPSLASTIWWNETTGAAISAPGAGTIDPYNAPVTIANAFALDATLLATNVLLGAINETAPGTDIASSGLNGRLQRIAKNLTDLKAIFNFNATELLVKVNQALPAGTNLLGQIQANAGTNLNTSLLALESGGNLANLTLEVGSNTDAGVVGDVNGSLSAKLRGLSKIWNDVWDSTNHKLNIAIPPIPGTLNNGATTTVAGTAIIISPANSANVKVIIQNTGNAPMAVGVSGVTITTGLILYGGGDVTFEIADGCKNDIYAIRTTAVSTTALAQPIR